MKQKLFNLLVINDNHCACTNEKYTFVGSKFHLFLKSFTKFNVKLSSPVDSNKYDGEVMIDGIRVLPRVGYGTASQFYLTIFYKLPFYIPDLYRHIRESDIVLLVAPASTLPISYLLSRVTRKRVAMYVVGDVAEVVGGQKSFYLHKVSRRFGAFLEWRMIRFIASRQKTFVLGSSVLKQLQPTGYDLSPAMTSLVSENSIHKVGECLQLQQARFLTVARLSPEKGIEIALRALAQIKEDNDFTYTIVGSGPHAGRLKQIAIDLGILERVIFAGYLDQEAIATKFLDADIFLLPSLSEGIPKVLLDAMAYAVPVIASDVGGIPDLVGKEQSRGWLVSPGDVNALRDAILDCIRNPDSRSQKLANAHVYIRDHTREKEAERIEQGLLELLGEQT